MKGLVSLALAAVFAVGIAASVKPASAGEYPVLTGRSVAVAALHGGSFSRQATPDFGGMDDGSGYWGPGTATGGPSGGLPDRN